MDDDLVFDIIDQFGFATVFSQHKGEPYATHLPLILNRSENVLYGHFSRSNEQWKDIGNQQVLVVFQGPHCYISPRWYETTRAVPTWNYVSVHVYGKMERMEDPSITYNSLKDLVRKYEPSESPYRLDDLDPKFLEGMSKGIVPFKINISNIEGKAKLSQNHSVERQALVIKQLEVSSEMNDRQIAALMKRNLLKG
jgi:transcriptional regulator